MRTAAVLPIKSFPNAKQRLRVALEPGGRCALATAMVQDVLAALAASRLDAVVVVTGEPVAAEAARRSGAQVVADPAEAGQSAGAERGIAAAVAGGAERVLLVPGDCPALDPAEIDALLASHEMGEQIVIVPDRHRTGTNALLLAPPDVIHPAFGPGSFARHAALGHAAGAAVAIDELPSLGHDVDTVDDLVAMRALLAANSRGAAHTRPVLDRLAPVLEAAG